MDLIVFFYLLFFFFVQHPDSYLPLRYVVKNIRIIEKELFLFLDQFNQAINESFIYPVS